MPAEPAPAPSLRAIGPVRLDDADRLIVVRLLADGRTTLKELAHHSGLSVSAVHARVHRLAAAGVIRGYTALVDPQAIGLPVAAIVTVGPLGSTACGLADRLAAVEEIESCYSVGGEDSLVLLVRTASLVALERLIHTIGELAETGTRTAVILQTHFEHRSPPRAEGVTAPDSPRSIRGPGPRPAACPPRTSPRAAR